MRILALLPWLLAPLSAEDERLLKDTSGATIIRYVVEAPARTAGPETLGLFLCFPEHDRPTGDEILPVREALKRQGLLDRYVLLAGHPQERKFGAADYEPIRKLIAWALKTYPINPRRVYMYGKGEGGKISGEFAMAHPELVAAAISYSWTWWKMPAELDQAIDPEKAPQFYMVLGRRDLAHHLTNVRDGYSRVQAKGYRVIYREFDELGARTYHPPSNDEAIAWAHGLRNRTLPLSAAERQGLARGTPADLAAVGHGPAIEKLFRAKEPAARVTGARLCAEVNAGEETVEALARLAEDEVPEVRREAVRALAVNAGWRSAAAQRALIRLATGGGPERISAADGLIQAVRFQVRGVRQDPPVFRALVELLAGPDEELRTMAANALAPVRDPEFRGDLGRPEKKAPEGGWAAWLEGITARNAGYAGGYTVCANPAGEAQTLFCQGEPLLKTRPAEALALTVKAAGLGYVPAQAMAGMLHAIGKGTPQNFAEAAQWWQKAAAAGHGLSAQNLSMLYRGAGQKTDAETLARLTAQAAEYQRSISAW